jgi:Lrp/AsnC family transcriptional regulator, regulator of ectoine-degradation genes
MFVAAQQTAGGVAVHEGYQGMKATGLDAADIRILCALQQHGQLTKSKLAELVGLSSTPCWTRFARLREAGLIRGYHADLALERIVDVCKVVVTVSLQSHRKANFARFEEYVRRHHDVVDCVATGGGMDYVMTVVTTSLPAFQSLMDEMLSAELGIDRYMTYIATREVKSAPANLGRLLAGRETGTRQ